MNKLSRLTKMMIEYYQNDPEQVNHFLKVYAYAQIIADIEEMNESKKEILLLASILHDVGCKEALEIYGSTAGKYQEELGPKMAEKMLDELEYDKEIVERVSFLVGHHHSYDYIDDLDFQILAEADFLVNFDESEKYYKIKEEALKNIFKTSTGISIYNDLFNQ